MKSTSRTVYRRTFKVDEILPPASLWAKKKLNRSHGDDPYFELASAYLRWEAHQRSQMDITAIMTYIAAVISTCLHCCFLCIRALVCYSWMLSQMYCYSIVIEERCNTSAIDVINMVKTILYDVTVSQITRHPCRYCSFGQSQFLFISLHI